ncbi:MAG: DUF4369 domain-containing protein [Carboxylicivirga sp.]|jgi:hypothetical protein|nr:DUF4369 domain-containing protein [Carboxylicivirga sp.]
MIKNILLFGLLLPLISCRQGSDNKTAQQSEGKFELIGNISGIESGYLYIENRNVQPELFDSIEIEDGKFKYLKELPVQMRVKLSLGDQSLTVYADNSPMLISLDKDNFKEVNIKGGKLRLEYLRYQKEQDNFVEKVESGEMEMPIYQPLKPKQINGYSMVTTQVNSNGRVSVQELYKAFRRKFINDNPTSIYIPELLEAYTYEVDKEVLEAFILGLDKEIIANAKTQHILTDIQAKKVYEKADVSLEKFLSGVDEVKYALDTKYNGQKFNHIVYMTAFSNDNICALCENGEVLIISPEGQQIRSFTPAVIGKATSIGVDSKNNIYLMTTEVELLKTKIRGRVIEKKIPKGTSCSIYNEKGEAIKSFLIKELKSASGIRIHQNKLMVSDQSTRQLAIIDIETENVLSTIKNLRACCGILDFDIDDKDRILVANLGAFKVEAYDLNGEVQMTFGQRGMELNDFIGCCNPVAVSSLSNGALVTVEKTPTRIKVYSQSGVKKIEGVKELVDGCSYIPLTVDSKDNLYLASPEKGIFKCIIL